jgi:hypothetical protein
MSKIKFRALYLLLVITLSVNAQDDLKTINVPDPNNPGETIPCGPEGTAKDGKAKTSHLAFIGNPNKNRFDMPDPSKINQVRVADLVKATKSSNYQTGEAVQVSGYVYDVKPGGVESCNCGTKDQSFIDTDVANRMIVEITPRMREIMEKQGIDWSTATLKEKILNHHVTVQGWLFYDEIHEPQAVSTNPSNASDWRGSCWEIHPITALNIDDPSTADADNVPENGGGMMRVQFQAPKLSPNINQTNTNTMQSTNSPLNTLVIILIGAILGAVGQGIRMIIGLKKTYDEALKTQTAPADLLVYEQLALSIFIAFGVGAIAGVLAVVTTDNIQFTKSTILAFIGSGYAGTDFIEGFMKKYPDVKSTPTAN